MEPIMPIISAINKNFLKLNYKNIEQMQPSIAPNGGNIYNNNA